MKRVVIFGTKSPEMKNPKYLPRMPFVGINLLEIVIFIQDLNPKDRSRWIKNFKKRHPNLMVTEYA